MLYRPNFCCNCGEKIERLEWNLLTSRRFCVVCSTENRAHDILPRLAITAGALAVMFGFGSLWSGSGQAEPRSGNSAVGIKSSVQTGPSVKAIASNAESRPDVPPNPDVQTTEQDRTGASVTAAADNTAATYFCGALTRKGTPCSRKVKGKGQRCFQHEGRPEAPASE